jgi:DNA processing protein
MEIRPPDAFDAADHDRDPGPPPEIAASDRQRVLAALSPSPVDIDELIRATDLSARKVQIVLLELDLAGRLQRHGRQLVSLLDPPEADG